MQSAAPVTVTQTKGQTRKAARRDAANRAAQQRGAALDARTYFAAISLVKREHEARLNAQLERGIAELGCNATTAAQGLSGLAQATTTVTTTLTEGARA